MIHIQVCKHYWYTQPPKRRLVESITFRTSQWMCAVRKDVLHNFSKFTGKHLCQSLFLIKLLALACNFIAKGSLAQMFFVNFAKFLGTPFLQNTSGRLLLYVVPTRSNTTLSLEKTSQRLNIPYRVLSKDALTNNHVRCVLLTK